MGAATAGSLGIASAATSANGQSTLIDKLVTKFNLNRDEVQKVFDEERASHQAEREQKMKERLDQAVKDGKLTQAQEDKLIAKLKEMQADRKNPKDATEADHEARKAKMDEFRQWLKDNNIPEEFGMPMRGHGGPPHAN